MERSNGYTQYKMNYVKDYARQIHEETIRMDMAWNNKDTLAKNDDAILEIYLASQRAKIERYTKELLSYIEPFEKEESK